jgi:hypothetical protein
MKVAQVLGLSTEFEDITDQSKKYFNHSIIFRVFQILTEVPVMALDHRRLSSVSSSLVTQR